MYAVGLCDVGDTYILARHSSVDMAVILLWKLHHRACDVKIYIVKEMKKSEIIDGLKKFDSLLMSIGVKYAYMVCKDSPRKYLAKAMNAKVTQLPIGCIYEWESEHG